MDTKHRYDIKNFKNDVINDIQRRYPSLPLYWVADQDELVDQIAQYSPERCVDLMCVCGDAITVLLGKDPFLENKITIELDFKKVVQETRIWDWGYLLDAAVKQKWEELKRNAKTYSPSMFVLGYVLILQLLASRLYLYISRNPHNLDSLYVRFSDILEQFPDSKPHVQNALGNLIKFVQNIYKKNTCNSIKDEEIMSYLGEAVKNAFPLTITESLISSAKGAKKINYIPNSAAKKLITNQVKSLKYSLESNSLDEPIKADSDITRKDIVPDSFDPDELIEILNNQEIIIKLMDVLRKKLTDRQRQVIQLLYVEDSTLEAAGKELGIRKQTVDEIHKAALKKLFSCLKSLKP